LREQGLFVVFLPARTLFAQDLVFGGEDAGEEWVALSSSIEVSRLAPIFRGGREEEALSLRGPYAGVGRR